MDVIQKTYISRMTKWANEMERALHALTGEGGFYPPFAFPSIIRGYKTKPVVVPDKKDVSPELLSDIQAVIDECNTAIAETFSDAPAKFSANDMPGIILAHVSAGGSSIPWTLLHTGTFTVTQATVTSVITQEVATVTFAPDVVCVSSMKLIDNGNSEYKTNVMAWHTNSFVTFSEDGTATLSWYKVTV